MQMSFRARVLDLLPVLVVFAIVSAFATFVVVEYVVREPLVVPRSVDDRETSAQDASEPSR